MVILSLGIVLCMDASDTKLLTGSLISAESLWFFLRLHLLHCSGVKSIMVLDWSIVLSFYGPSEDL